ncbi:MAG TPA: hypothetical protein VGI39_13330 [Polyangiaceae bacterium]
MGGSKPDDREVQSPAESGTTRAASASLKASKAVPPPLPPSGRRSNPNLRAELDGASAQSAARSTPDGASAQGGARSTPDAVSAARAARSAADPEAPSLYSRVGRRTTPGMPAVAVAIESVKVGPTARASAEETSMPAVDKVPVPPPSASSLERAEKAEEKSLARLPPSARPPAPEPFRASFDNDNESIAQSFDRLVATDPGPSPGPPPASGSFADGKPESLSEPRELFGRLAAAHVRPVRELIIDLRWGEAPRDSFIASGAAVASLGGAAEKLGLVELAKALRAFGDALAPAPGEAPDPGANADVLHPAARARVLAAYEELVRLLPVAFAFEDEQTQRESVIVESIVMRIPGAHRVTLEKIVAAGLGSISTLADAPPRELSTAAGITVEVAKAIVEAFRAYRDERRAAPPGSVHQQERARLRELALDLDQQNSAFEQASTTWTSEATEAKRRLRRERERTVMEISALLARLGEVGLLEKLERMPFDQKLEGLRSFLKDGPKAAAH